MDGLLVKEIDIKQEIILSLNDIIIKQSEQIQYYRGMLLLLQENLNLIQDMLNDDNN